MAKRWIALNILLLVAVVGLGRELYRQYDHFKTNSDSAKIESVFVENQEPSITASDAYYFPADVFREAPAFRDDDYFVISERTVFSDVRGREEPVQVVAPKIVPLTNPKPILVGTVMIDGQYTASVIDQASAQQRGGQLTTETWNVGTFYRGFFVTSIGPDQLVLENGPAREVLTLNRNAKIRPVAKPAGINTASVVSIGPGAGASGGVSVLTASAVGMAPGRGGQAKPVQMQAKAKPGQGQAVQPAQAVQAGRGPATVTTPEGVTMTLPEGLQDVLNAIQGKPVQGKPQGKPVQGGGQAQPQQPQQQVPLMQQQIQQQLQQLQQQRVISSPFGDIVRPGSQ